MNIKKYRLPRPKGFAMTFLKSSLRAKRSNLFTTLLLFILLPLQAEEVLTKSNASWSTVLPGTVLCEPVETSYGFCLVTDARTVIAYSTTGKQLWEKPIGRSRNVELAVLKDDFLLILEKNENLMKVLNPSGTEIWSKKLDFIPRSTPLVGYDGRFFVYCENKIQCFGINGLCKWQIETPNQKNIPLQQLPDGSIVVFYNETQNSQDKTIGMRISPFGKLIEEITFAGNVQQSFSCKDGILLIFTDGTSGLFSIQDKSAKNKWVLQKKVQNSTFVVSADLSTYFYLELNSNNVIINKINGKNGQILQSKKVENISALKLKKTYCNKTGIFLCDEKNATLYNDDLEELFLAKMPTLQQQNYNFLINLYDNQFIFCNKDWSMSSFRMHQTAKKMDFTHLDNSYDHFYDDQQFLFDLNFSKEFSEEIINEHRTLKLKNGFYGNLETEYLNEILTICKSYSTEISSFLTGTRKTNTIFDEDSNGFQNILLQLTLFSNQNTQNLSAKILKNCTDSNYSLYLLSNVGGYDPDGELLSALEKLSSKVNSKDTNYINAICDCVYRICFFMGRPAYNTKGKVILKQFLNPNYNTKNKKYARQTLEKIIALEL